MSSTWTPSFYGYDGHGNVRFLTSSAGAVTDTYKYDAFGVQIGGTGSTPNSFLYSGEQYDSTLHLYYLRARYYNPVLGRFQTMDPWHLRQSCTSKSPSWTNAYAFVSDDPVNRFDPTGRAEAVAEYAIDLRDVLLTAWVNIQIYKYALQQDLECDLMREEFVPDKGVRCHYDCHHLGERCIDLDGDPGGGCAREAPSGILTPCEKMDPYK